MNAKPLVSISAAGKEPHPARRAATVAAFLLIALTFTPSAFSADAGPAPAAESEAFRYFQWQMKEWEKDQQRSMRTDPLRDLRTRGLLPGADPEGAAALDALTQSLGAGHPAVLNARSRRATRLYSQSDPARFVQEHREILRIMGQAIKPVQGSNFTNWPTLGDAFAFWERYQDFEIAYRAQLAIGAQTSDEGRPEMLRTRKRIIDMLSAQGKHEGIAVMYRNLLTLEKQALGAEKPETLAALAAFIDKMVGNRSYPEAEAASRILLLIKEQTQQPLTPESYAMRLQVAIFLEVQGKLEEALPLYRQAEKEIAEVLETAKASGPDKRHIVDIAVEAHKQVKERIDTVQAKIEADKAESDQQTAGAAGKPAGKAVSPADQ